MSPFPFWGLPPQPLSMNPPPQKPRQPPRPAMNVQSHCPVKKPYPDFKFNHMFSFLVVGPTQCGKTYFVEQLLTKNSVKYPSKKPRRILRFSNQWQSRYVSFKSTLGEEIVFTQGLPTLSEDLRDINPKWNTIWVFDDLMTHAAESTVLLLLFTQGRHRNSSVILLLQNMFRKENSTRILAETLST